ncbi:IS1595 family transposase [Azospirillum soli]|uniref:IS1595 family transposase n=1 Tax=Azospirillum soli TaxID=1304799 RepID=UPI001AE74AE4|nr:IS1595 family transposase [Azospirillum soli]MBP2316947.1 transposase-like protein [Azospirillum soli]
MSQHFLLSAAARSISLRAVLRMEEAEAWGVFQRIRWDSTGGKPVCPECGSLICYDVSRGSRPRYRCRDCRKDFTPTSGTLFASHKLPISVYLAAIVLFVNAAKGISALQLGRDLDISYKTAFVLCHKLREAMATETRGMIADGEVEVDGCHVGGYVKPANFKENRRDRRKAVNQNGKRRVVVAIRDRDGRTLTSVFKSEDEATGFIASRVAKGSTIHADEAAAWDKLHARFPMKRINHSEAYSADGACTNMAESFFSRLRRAEEGQHHHISGVYLARYAGEMAWREDHRRESNGMLFNIVAGRAARMGQSVDFTGYWQRRKTA